jgi:transposase
MAAAYSNDLRRKFLLAYDKGKGSLAGLAERFEVSVGWAKKISARRTRTGEIDLRPWRPGRKSRVTPEIQEFLRKQIRRQPDRTLLELQEQLQAARGLRLSIGGLWLALQQMGLRLKKSHSTRRSKKRRRSSRNGKPGGKR